MRAPQAGLARLRAPELIAKASQLGSYLKTLPIPAIVKIMGISTALATKTHEQIANWSAEPSKQSVAIDSFIGDIYSGLQVKEFSANDRAYADKTLRILSGLYGIIRPLDGICPYRLEMAYKLPDPKFSNLYKFWADSVANCLPKTGLIINLAAVEYSKVVTPFVSTERIITPRFYTQDPKTGEPKFVVVHAKIARGAFAKWLIKNRINKVEDLTKFNDLGYRHNVTLSTAQSPAFVCADFGGKGLSVRLAK